MLAAVPATSAAIAPGTRGSSRGTIRMIASEASVRATAGACVVGSACQYASILAMNSPGTAVIVRPSASLICVEAMRMAMPLVKPIRIGRGMNLTAVPSPVTASPASSTPAIIVTIISPDMPCCAMMPATITTNAPVGPPICTRDPPSSDTTRPPTMAVYKPASGVVPEAMPKAMASGRATRPTVRPAMTSEVSALVVYPEARASRRRGRSRVRSRSDSSELTVLFCPVILSSEHV